MTGKRKERDDRLPVSLLAGFLGAGKTTLLKHILETKKQHQSQDFRCAVIVNDMAELNIDKSLIAGESIRSSSSEERVISMQNGCVCCTLRSDLENQIIELATSSSEKKNETNNKFDYVIIEASGVSEPAEIARLFAVCNEDHDHDEKHNKQKRVSDVARLDTIVTVVDSSEFFQNLDTVLVASSKNKKKDDDKKNEKAEQEKAAVENHHNNINDDGVLFPELMIKQIEYSNVVLLNKTDLVSDEQSSRIRDHISVLNPKAKTVSCQNGAVDVVQVLNTGLYNESDFSSSTTALFQTADDKDESSPPSSSCCGAAEKRGESPCCGNNKSRARSRTIDSGKSQVTLPPNKRQKTRHEEKHGITSFLYQARRPFHSERFHRDFLDRFFVQVDRTTTTNTTEEEDDDFIIVDEGGDEELIIPKQARDTEEVREAMDFLIKKRQEEGMARKEERYRTLGKLLRTKGFVWMVNTHDLKGVVSSAGNIVTMESPGTWTVLEKKAWEGTSKEKASLRENWVAPYGDRRQELVFIGQDLKQRAIQEILDGCLLTDDEFAMGVDGWKATMGDVFLNGLDDDDEDDNEDAEEAMLVGVEGKAMEKDGEEEEKKSEEK